MGPANLVWACLALGGTVCAMWTLFIGTILACAPLGHRSPARAGDEAIPVAVRDGEVLSSDGVLRFGLIGGYNRAPPSLDQDLRGASLDFVVLAGDAVERGTARAYRVVAQRLAGIPLSPLPGSGERRRDPHLRRYALAWSGLGVRGSSEFTTWRAFDLRSVGHTWRMVLLDADREALGERAWDEQFWLPKAISSGEEPLIIVMNRPIDSLARGSGASEDARELHEAVSRYVPGSRVALVAFADGVCHLMLPGGGWGEAWLGIGPVGGAPETLLRARGERHLVPGLDEALALWFAERGGDATLLDAGLDYDAEHWPIVGWWLVEIAGEEMHIALRLTRNDTWQEVYTARWTRDGGWTDP